MLELQKLKEQNLKLKEQNQSLAGRLGSEGRKIRSEDLYRSQEELIKILNDDYEKMSDYIKEVTLMYLRDLAAAKQGIIQSPIADIERRTRLQLIEIQEKNINHKYKLLKLEEV